MLYAPTFRDDPEKDRELLSRLDTGLFNRYLGEEYALLVRLHPQIHADTRTLEGAVDLTAYPDVSELVLLCDVLVTDYSSIVMDLRCCANAASFMRSIWRNMRRTGRFILTMNPSCRAKSSGRCPNCSMRLSMASLTLRGWSDSARSTLVGRMAVRPFALWIT